ncbi:extracellular solute-binding protein [Paenibacillus sp. J5C_2022]|uniref:extracellular solute-binding protein n=1 Tax=Paenibacillus sp. J5C2022 TaxID=2977129 RepID=UPI0021D29714|nr:extracellular solute-binding protein [Paenibacillus sp. J5C2022]MCU6710338.1 extracellular solute-binding protein [Paenibacillus sp. J5C2022]
MSTKRKLGMLALVAMLTAALTAGCSGNETKENGTGNTGGNAKGENASESGSNSGAKKEEKQLKELKIFAELSGHLSSTGKSNNDNLVFQEMEKRTGVKVEWMHPPTGQANEKFNLMLSSGELPDVMMYGFKGLPGGAAKLADDGAIIPLNDLIDKHAPNFKRYLDENPQLLKEIASEDGQIYNISMLRMDPALRIYVGPQLRKDWLDALELPVPTTIDELYATLKAFKEQDPNGNGEQDEIPYSGSKFKDTIFAVGKLLWPFGSHYDFMVKEGQVTYGPLEPEFKEGMAFINKLYNEGLLDPDYVLLDRSKLDNKVMADKVGAMYHFQMQKFMTNMAEKDPEFKLVAMPHLTGPSGQQLVFESAYTDISVPSFSIAITTANKHPEETMEWLDYAFSEEGNMLFNFGVEGLTYEMKDGKPVYTDLITNNSDGLSLTQSLGKHVMALTGWPMAQDVEYFNQMMPDFSVEAINVWKDVSTASILPILSYTAEEDKQQAKLLAEIATYADEMFDKFVMGIEPLEKYDEFVSQLKKMGIEEAIAIKQAAYDRYMNK